MLYVNYKIQVLAWSGESFYADVNTYSISVRRDLIVIQLHICASDSLFTGYLGLADFVHLI